MSAWDLAHHECNGLKLMPIARGIAPGISNSSAAADVASPHVLQSLDDDADMILFSVVGDGGLPGDEGRAPLRGGFEESQTDAPYWATWGF